MPASKTKGQCAGRGNTPNTLNLANRPRWGNRTALLIYLSAIENLHLYHNMLHDSSIGNLWPLTGQRLQNFNFNYAMNESLNAISALQAFSHQQNQAAPVLKVNIA